MEATKNDAAEERCEKTGGHDYRASRTIPIDPWGVKTRRQYFCTFCGKDRPRRKEAPRV